MAGSFPLYLEDLRKSASPEFDPHAISRLGMIPNYYLAYYYEEKEKLKEQDQWPPSRAEQVMEVEKELLDYYQDTAQNQNSRKPDETGRGILFHGCNTAHQLPF